MIEWNYIVITLSLLLLIFLIWKEIYRPNKARLVWRIVASTLAILSLACLALPINYTKTVKVSSANDVILLTEGFDSDSVNLLIKSNNNIPIFTIDDKLLTSKKFNATFASSIKDLEIKQRDIGPIHVFGDGLNLEEINELDSQRLVFHPSKNKTGVNSIHWTNRLKTGEKLYVQGSFNNNSSSAVRIILSAFNATVDSIKIPPNKLQQFELTTIPKHTGRNVYSLVVLNGSDTISKDPIPIQVEQGEALKVLILASAPDFENKFLKNWLGQKGFQVVTRTLTSKNKYTKDFLNIDAVNVDRITPALLNNFNIVIADAAELASISRNELETIQSSVSAKSLGLVVRASDKSSSAFYSNRFPVAAVQGTQQQQIHLQLIDTATNFQTLTIESPLAIRNQNATQPIVTDRQNRIFVNSTLYGSGKIIFTTVNNTFNWMIAGNAKDYEEFWSEILNKATGKETSDETWGVSPALPRVNRSATIIVETNQTNIPTAQVATASVYLKNDPHLPYKWSGTFWPSKAGWQPTIQLNGNTIWWYAFDKNDWKSVDAFAKITRTKQYAASDISSPASNEATEKKQQTEFPKIYFFLIFLICCGFLWFENKIL